jgi:Xaa-Pro dipeptidase
LLRCASRKESQDLIQVPKSEIAARLAMFQTLLASSGVDAAIIRQNADLYYFTGTVQDAHLIVPASGYPTFLVRRDVERAESLSPIRPIVPLRSLAELLPALVSSCHGVAPRRVGMELDVLPASLFFMYSEKLFPGREVVDVSPLVRRMRMIKSEWELEMMRGAGSISRAIADAVPQVLREGISEVELYAELQAVAHQAGHLGINRCRTFNMEMAFGHVLSGPEAAIPSYIDSPTGGEGFTPTFAQGASGKKIRRGELVSVDTMACWHGYLNDQTRNYSLGPPPLRLQEGYRAAAMIHERFRPAAKPGAVTGELYEMVWRWVGEWGWEKEFMGTGEPRVNFVAHGLGLEVDEFPFIAQSQTMRLEEGMTFAFEPKFIVPGVGIAGLENTYVVRPDGLESMNTASEDLLIL